MDPEIFHGSGTYYCEQNRNNIGQNSNLNIICFFQVMLLQKAFEYKEILHTYHQSNFILTCAIENPLVQGIKTLRNFGQIC